MMTDLDPSRIAGVFTVAVIEPNDRLRTELALVVPIEVRMSAFATIEAFQGRPPDPSATVAIFGPSFSDAAGLRAIAELTGSRSDAFAAILVASALTAATLQQALRAGVRDVVDGQGGVDPAELQQAITRASGGLGVGEVVRADPGAPNEPGRVIAVASSKGGAGKSVVATNLAVALARKGRQPVVLVDADLQFGDVAVMLSLSPRTTIFDAVDARDRLDGPALESLLIDHPSGLRVLAAPTRPGDAENISAASMIKILGLLREAGACVVVDTSAHFDDVILSILDDSDDIVLVAGMDVPSVKNVRIALETLRLLGTPMGKARLVLNRVSDRIGLDVAEVEHMLGLAAACRIPFDLAVARSVNVGMPIVLEAPRSVAAKSIDDLADLLVGTAAPASKRRWKGRA